jgi:hypothetical protein
MRFGVDKGIPTKSLGKDQLPVLTRRSGGFDQFCSMLNSGQNLSILDMSGASQANITFITGLGHRISSDDIVGTMQQCFGDDFMENQSAASNAQRFLDQTLTFPDQFFDGALVWDAFQFLSSPVLDQTVGQLLRVMRPGGIMLFFFNSDEKALRAPVYNYRIQDQKTLLQIPRGNTLQRTQFFNNRTIERIFQSATSVKFFLSRDNLREVIVRR